MRTMHLSAILLVLLVPSQARAEYKRVELKILGMDCATCAHGVRIGVQKVAGVESVELSLERAEADIKLADGNRVPLDQFRRVVKGNGFEPKEARVTVRGTVREIAGKLVLDVSGPGTSLVISPDKSAQEPYKHAQERVGIEEHFHVRGRRNGRARHWRSRDDRDRERQAAAVVTSRRRLSSRAGSSEEHEHYSEDDHYEEDAYPHPRLEDAFHELTPGAHHREKDQELQA